MHWLERALALARRAGSDPMTAYVVMRQAQQAADRLDGPRTLALAGVAATTAGLSDRDRALCAIRHAQGHALSGDRPACGAALKAAYRLVARADQAGAEEDAATIGHHCVRAYVQAHEGYCRLRLGRAAEGARLLEEALAGWPAGYRQDQGLAHAWLALSYAEANRAAEAGVEGSRALALTMQTWSSRTLRVLRRVDDRLAITSRTTEVTLFRTAFSAAAGQYRM